MYTKEGFGRTLKALALATTSLLAVAAAGAQTTGSTNTVTPRYGNLSPFYGNLSPFYGNLSPFYGNLSPFYGNLSPFWGNLSPFYGNLSPFYGNLSPFYGNLSPFYGNLSPFTAPTDPTITAYYGTANNPWWGAGASNPFNKSPNVNVNYSQISGFWSTAGSNWTSVMNAWSTAQTPADYKSLANQIQSTILNPASSFWSKAVSQGTLAQGGSGITVGASMPWSSFVSGQLSRAGVALNSDGSIDSTSLAGLTQTQQGMFFLNWYDSLMDYSGTGHVDCGWVRRAGRRTSPTSPPGITPARRSRSG